VQETLTGTFWDVYQKGGLLTRDGIVKLVSVGAGWTSGPVENMIDAKVVCMPSCPIALDCCLTMEYLGARRYSPDSHHLLYSGVCCKNTSTYTIGFTCSTCSTTRQQYSVDFKPELAAADTLTKDIFSDIGAVTVIEPDGSTRGCESINTTTTTCGSGFCSGESVGGKVWEPAHAGDSRQY